MVLTELSPFIMAKHFGVSLQQAQRVQALLRLGVTEEDVSIAERLMRSRSDGPDQVDTLSPFVGERRSKMLLAWVPYQRA